MVYNMLMHNSVDLPGFARVLKPKTYQDFHQRAEQLRLLSEISLQFAYAFENLGKLDELENEMEAPGDFQID